MIFAQSFKNCAKVRIFLEPTKEKCTKNNILCTFYIKRIQLFSFSVVFLVFHQLTITYTLRFFIAETLHLVFFVFRV